MKNHTDMLIFHTAICVGASQIATDGRRELDVLVATPSLRSGMEDDMKKSVAVLGLGKYGKSLAENLYRMGADVLAVDKDESVVNEIASKCTAAICANLENEDEVMALELKNMDIVVSAMGSNLAASIMCVAVAKDQKVPVVVAKSSNDRMSSILKKIGVDKILDPEGEGGLRSASILLSNSFRDFFELDSNMYMIEMDIKKEWSQSKKRDSTGSL